MSCNWRQLLTCISIDMILTIYAGHKYLLLAWPEAEKVKGINTESFVQILKGYADIHV